MKYILIDPAGNNISRYNVPTEDFLVPMPEGFAYVFVNEEDDLDAMEAVLTEDSVIVRVRVVPDSEALERQKGLVWEEAKAERERHINAGVLVEVEPGMIAPFDSDQLSQDYIKSGVLAASIPAIAAVEFPKTWTLADNSYLTVSAEQMMAIGGTVLGYVSACHDRGRVLRDLIRDATTLEELSEIPISTGWP